MTSTDTDAIYDKNVQVMKENNFCFFYIIIIIIIIIIP